MKDISPEARIRAAIEQSANRLDIISREIVETQHDLADFMEYYYGKTEFAFRLIKRLDQVIQKYKPSDKPSVMNHSYPVIEPETRQGIISQQKHQKEEHEQTGIKQLYLMLARKYHPDSGGDDDEVIKSINRAYKQHHFGSLWKIASEQEWTSISQLGAAQRTRALNYYLAQIKDNLKSAEAKLRRIHASDAYQLKLRVFKARLAGEDLVADIVAAMEAELAEKQRVLEYFKLREQLRTEETGFPVSSQA